MDFYKKKKATTMENL